MTHCSPSTAICKWRLSPDAGEQGCVKEVHEGRNIAFAPVSAAGSYRPLNTSDAQSRRSSVAQTDVLRQEQSSKRRANEPRIQPNGTNSAVRSRITSRVPGKKNWVCNFAKSNMPRRHDADGQQPCLCPRTSENRCKGGEEKHSFIDARERDLRRRAEARWQQR